MNKIEEIFCCPFCHESLTRKPGSFLCQGCGKTFQVYAEVPNFKEGELYPGEDKLLRDIEKDFDRLSFFQLQEKLDSTTAKDILPWELRRAKRFQSLNEKEKKKYLEEYEEKFIMKQGADQVFVSDFLMKLIEHPLKRKTALDIGCGRGSWAINASREFELIVATDMDMASLLIARKYCLEKGINNIFFAGCLSRKLPFPDNSFDIVNSQAVIEHVDDQPVTFREINRTLAEKGYFIGDSCNRYNLFTAEFHTGIWWLGFLPHRLAHRFSLWLKDFPFDDIVPLSYSKLKKNLDQHLGDYKILPLIKLPQPSITQTFLSYWPSSLLQYLTHTHYILAGKKAPWTS
ncbi:MAG: class I SAM-dependent methyltransferase [bacterium]